MEILLMVAVFIGLMYVMMVMPQRKKMEQQRKMLSALEPGSRVMLNTGMFGTIRATGESQMVVELAPGVEVTVLKQAVMRAALPDEEEFEYSDGDESTTADEFVADGSIADSWQANPSTLSDTDLNVDEPVDFAQPPADSSALSPSAPVDFADQPSTSPVDFAPPSPDLDRPDTETDTPSR